MEEVKLLGALPSPFTYRVVWVLKLKGINYTNIQQDLSNKSELLLKSNPINKKVPVLIHGEKTIPESSVILEYIEDTWPEKRLLPKEPYQKAVARFWIKFLEDKIVCLNNFFLKIGEEQEKAVTESLEMLQTIEEHSGISEKKFFGGEEIGLVDLIYGIIAHWLPAIEEVIGVKFFESQKFPHLYAWTENFKKDPFIKENLPDFKTVVAVMKARREAVLATMSP
ncbi:glutathione transferase [Ranunculus cassubicifolius]